MFKGCQNTSLLYKMTDPVYDIVFGSQANHEVRLHAIYTVEFLGYSQKETAKIYGKSEGTISRWVNRYRLTGDVERVKSKIRTKFSDIHRNWVITYVEKDPLAFLHEISQDFF
eukprot:Pompholyxophrys_punicea_v1_NODE_778_length_1311_cov_2.330414.p2 type:complete len:113 gc:universal NODE_778_length_1311_cov_2.330414:213-551(+)